MQVSAFDFDLPPERIALRPAVPRESARLLEVGPATVMDGQRMAGQKMADRSIADRSMADRRIADLPNLFRPGDVLVVNDTRVIPARLTGLRERNGASARIDVTLHKREGGDLWRAFVRPAKKLHDGEMVSFGVGDGRLVATCVEHAGAGEIVLRFAVTGHDLDRAIERHGVMPLPPYIAAKRAIDGQDRADYQTLFAARPGAVAAPTASLHFTPQLVAAIEERGAKIVRVTLHVGAGTFLPVKVEDTSDHHMHAEWGAIDDAAAAACTAAKRAGARIVAAGTTSLRILESAAQTDGSVRPFAGDTSIFITPGYRFRAVDALITNFHLPRSTLFMLVSAFAGLETMRQAYAHAIDSGYRFYSYGDACFLHGSAALPVGNA